MHSALKEIQRLLGYFRAAHATLLSLMEPPYKNTSWEICQVRLEEDKTIIMKHTKKSTIVNGIQILLLYSLLLTYCK